MGFGSSRLGRLVGVGSHAFEGFGVVVPVMMIVGVVVVAAVVAVVVVGVDIFVVGSGLGYGGLEVVVVPGVVGDADGVDSRLQWHW